MWQRKDQTPEFCGREGCYLCFTWAGPGKIPAFKTLMKMVFKGMTVPLPENEAEYIFVHEAMMRERRKVQAEQAKQEEALREQLLAAYTLERHLNVLVGRKKKRPPIKRFICCEHFSPEEIEKRLGTDEFKQAIALIRERERY